MEKSPNANQSYFYKGAAAFDLSNRGRIRVEGEDRLRLLHALTTNHIQQLLPGQGAYAFFLTAQGRIISDANILCFPDSLLVDTEPEVAGELLKHIDHYIIADDVTLTGITETTFAVALEGPEAAAILTGLGAPLPAQAEASHLEWNGLTVSRLSFTGIEGYRLFGEGEQQRQALLSKLERAGATLLPDLEAATAVRIEQGIPRYGEDIAGSTLPQETGIERAIHFRKGCYLGQEIVERIHSRGRVNKQLRTLSIEGSVPPAPGTKVMESQVEAGEITSAAYSEKLGRIAAISMIRLSSAGPHALLTVNGLEARLRPPESR